MTEIESFTTFRTDVAPPRESVRDAARERLVATTRGDRAGAHRRLSRRRFGLAAAVAVALVAAVFATVSLVGGGAGVLDKAEAAIDPQGRILHVVVSIEHDGTVTRGESWVRPGGGGRSLELSGSERSDCVGSETQLRCFDAARNVVDVYRYYADAVEAGRRHADLPGFRVDRPESIHRAFGEGYASLVGESTLRGRSVYEIQLAVPYLDAQGKATPRFDEATSPILYLDRETYHPVAERFPDSGSVTYYERYEFLEDDATTRRFLELPTNAATHVIVHPIGEGPES